MWCKVKFRTQEEWQKHNFDAHYSWSSDDEIQVTVKPEFPNLDFDQSDIKVEKGAGHAIPPTEAKRFECDE